jgi:hypothetical protein
MVKTIHNKMCGITSCCFCVGHATGSMAGSAVAAVFCALNLIIQIIIGFLPGIAGTVNIREERMWAFLKGHGVPLLVNALMFLSCLPLYLGSKKRKHFYLIPFLIIYGLGTPTDLGIAFYQVMVDTFKSWHWIPLLATGARASCCQMFL